MKKLKSLKVCLLVLFTVVGSTFFSPVSGSSSLYQTNTVIVIPTSSVGINLVVTVQNNTMHSNLSPYTYTMHVTGSGGHPSGFFIASGSIDPSPSVVRCSGVSLVVATESGPALTVTIDDGNYYPM
ncbi:hypothetical protein ORI89_16145 [Sphingobacterium sp. UT-1RO-CII-1]|uniref:hypothetical protein n=1 Tax=Sphingobacterium sp. UT-1RO-CII-1 TaxID=2995225 RepID=UPI00227C9BAC|nr:hypothetical protein [Sphingobacterium sp. UT-1RO-CII-1]MCY4781194.1 hypothetical protein [Sphingobacterium sp. UT-1RO-CII-1]